MRGIVAILLAGATLLAQAGSSPSTVKVAAVQCYSRMAATDANAAMLNRLIREAASNGAKIVVLPECALTGYMNPAADEVWSADGIGGVPIACHALVATAAVVTAFSTLAKDLQIYLCLPFAELDGTNYFNAQLLFDPVGQTVAHHRKRHLWPPGDASWVTPGEQPTAVASTPYGRLGLIICYEVHVLPSELVEAHADIVLYSIGWYGPNTEAWFRDVFPARYAKAGGFAVIGANWSSDRRIGTWPGTGYSFIVDKGGKMLAQADDAPRPQIVYGTLPVARD